MKIINSRTYIITETIKDAINCEFMNRLGCWDTLQLTRNVDTVTKSTVSTFKRGTQVRVGLSNADKNVTYHSQYLNQAEYERYVDMLNIGIIYVNAKLVIPLTGTAFKRTNTDDFWVFELVIANPNDEPSINF